MVAFYKESSSDVMWEQMGKDIMISNLKSGVCCSINTESGSLVWLLSLSGMETGEVCNYLQDYYGSSDIKKKEIEKFLQDLESKDLLKALKASEASSGNAKIDLSVFSKKYTIPKAVYFSDMDSLLQLDPIDAELSEKLDAGT